MLDSRILAIFVVCRSETYRTFCLTFNLIINPSVQKVKEAGAERLSSFFVNICYIAYYADVKRMRCPLFFVPNAQKWVVSTYIFGDYNYIFKDMVTLELLVDYADLVAKAEQIQAIAPAIIAAIIGAGASLGGSAIAGRNSAKANQAAEQTLADQQTKNESWYKEKMNENYLESAEAQAAINKAKEMANDQMVYARGAQAVMGGTSASMAAAQESANKLMSDTISGVAAQSTARKDAAEQTYMNRNNDLAQQLIQMYGNKAANNAAAGSSALSALGGIGSSLITALGNK